MINLLKDLCELNGTSGNEAAVREYILEQIKGYAQCSVDNMGNIIAFRKGKKTPEHKIMLDAHMDEVGFIVTYIDDDGFLSFDTVGGVLIAKVINLFSK